ncbi:hypothetical protein DV738_g4433, partial [Chaetothyriales sp. CBS 135597]
MSDLAREEADRFFSNKERLTSHPEDREDDEKKGGSDFDGSNHGDRDRYERDLKEEQIEIDLPHAQNFERAKQSTFRSKLNSFTQHISSAYNKRESWLGGPPRPVRRVSHQRTWGIVQDVDASGYLDAVEKAGADEVVVVLIYDGGSSWSRSIELELGMLAYKYSRTRFVKLDQDIAEMESVEVPAVLAYRGGDVFATISGADADRLEDELKGYGVLPRSL